MSAPRPVYTAPNRPPEAAPREKKPKRQSIYANQNGGILQMWKEGQAASAHGVHPAGIANPKKGFVEAVGRPGGEGPERLSFRGNRASPIHRRRLVSSRFFRVLLAATAAGACVEFLRAIPTYGDIGESLVADRRQPSNARHL